MNLRTVKPDKNKQKNAEAGKARRNRNSRKAGNTNTGPMFYFSNQTVKQFCQKEAAAIKKHCGDEKDASKKSAKAAPRTNSKLGELSDKVHDALDSVQDGVKKAYGYDPDKADTQWMGEHCDGLWMKPMGSGEFSQFNKKLEEIEAGLKQQAKAILESTGSKVIELAKDTAISYGQKVAARTGVAAASLVVPVAGEVIMVGTTVWNVVDGVWTAGKVAIAALNIKDELMAKYKLLEPQLAKAQSLLSKDPKSITASSVVAEMMTEKAKHNPCITARKCSLVPYDETDNPAKAAKSGNGCCPGQTGHHVLPGAMFDVEKQPCARKYDHDKAPTICLEGTNNSVGSHGRAHTELEASIDLYKEQGHKTISYKDASKRGIDAVRQANPNCSEKCLQAQLDKHYKDNLKCKEDAQLKPNPGKPERAATPKPAAPAAPAKAPRARTPRKK